MNDLNAYILAKITDMEQERNDSHIVPSGIEMPDLQKRVIEDIKTAINDLCRQGEIVYYKTLNSVAFRLCNRTAQLHN